MPKQGEYFLEFRRIGNFIKVTAVDPITYTEVCISVPGKGVSRQEMTRLAIQKLEYVLKKNRQEEGLY